MRRTRLLLLAVLTLFAAPLLAQDIHCTQIANTTNCTSGSKAAIENSETEIAAAVQGTFAAVGQFLAMRKLRKDAEVNAATAVAFCQLNLDEKGCGYTLAFIQAYCTIYDPKLGKLNECKQMRSSFEPPLLTPLGAFVSKHEGSGVINPHDVNANPDSKERGDMAVRVVFCQKYPDSVVYAPNDVVGTQETGKIKDDEGVSVNTCAFDLKYANARCAVVDPQYRKQLACALLKFEPSVALKEE